MLHNAKGGDFRPMTRAIANAASFRYFADGENIPFIFPILYSQFWWRHFRAQSSWCRPQRVVCLAIWDSDATLNETGFDLLDTASGDACTVAHNRLW